MSTLRSLVTERRVGALGSPTCIHSVWLDGTKTSENTDAGCYTGAVGQIREVYFNDPRAAYSGTDGQLQMRNLRIQMYQA